MSDRSQPFVVLGAALLEAPANSCTSSSIFPAIELKDPPAQLARDLSGAGVLSNAGTIEFHGAAGDEGPRNPQVDESQRAAALTELLEERRPIAEYSSVFGRQGGIITCTRRVGLFARSVPVERYATVAARFAKMEQADTRVITIRRGED